MRRNSPQRRTPKVESLEDRLCLASSVGWDGPGRGSASLTYYIANAPSSLSQAKVNSALRAALNVWSLVASVRFTQTSRPGLQDSIDFSFRPIDGRDRTLSQAYLPDDLNRSPLAGDVQFDSAERWEVGNAQGGAAHDLVLTAIHEIGHALGLEHSRTPGAVMYPVISANQRYTGLTASDVVAIQSLYARPIRLASVTTAPAVSASATAAPADASSRADTSVGPTVPVFVGLPPLWRHRNARGPALRPAATIW